ncbi:MAG: hypothetical protein R2939_03695 [Kofleriaceae bacterium]
MLARRTSLLALALAAGCSIGAPPGFSDGDSWSAPLVGPLESGVLIVPVFIDDQGPYLMRIDPDANQSIIDEALASELALLSGWGGRMLDESDTTRPTRFAKLRALRVGTLTVRKPLVQVTPVGTFSTSGRILRGVLGKDVLADSLVFGFDRDRGLAYLATQQGFTPPTGAVQIGYDIVSSVLAVDIPPAGRRVTTASIGGTRLNLHLDLGEPHSQLRQALWAKAGLAAVPASATLVDEVGTRRTVNQAGLASNVALGPIVVPQLMFLPYGDRRWEEEDVDGTLGLNAMRDQVVWANLDKHVVYLTPRPTEDLLTERLARWNSPELAACAHPGCVSIAGEATAVAPTPMVDADAPAEPAPGAGAPGMIVAAPPAPPAGPGPPGPRGCRSRRSSRRSTAAAPAPPCRATR